jgi:anthranilate/para-aminobenzoate synthase component I
VAVVRRLALAPDPLAIARALQGAPGLAVLASRPQGSLRSDDARYSFVACEPSASSSEIIPEEELLARGTDPTRGRVEATVESGWNGARAAPRWIGVVPYEGLRALERPRWTRHPDDRPACGLARPAWRRYPAVVRVDHFDGSVCVEADDPASAASLARALQRGWGCARGSFRVKPLASDEAEQAHIDRVQAALRLIAAGDLYEINLARRIGLIFQGDAGSLFESLLAAAPTPWGFFQDLGDTVVCGSSPELALSVKDGMLRSCPIKGTRPRGLHVADDAKQRLELCADPKEQAELVMAIDVHRSDLGRVAIPGSVRVLDEPRLLAGRAVWSRVAEVVARKVPGTSLGAVASAVLPCGSVTGAPKVRAMEVIARLEPWRRGVYTGAFGYVSRNGDVELAMSIRTLEISKAGSEKLACYFAGGGIVADSIPQRELEETRWKAAQLSALISP